MNMDNQCMADVRSVLHGRVSLAAVNQICVIQEAVNGCKGLLRKCKYYIRPVADF